MEIAFAFDTLENSVSMVGDPVAAQPMADQMSEAWISFARHGDPNARGLPYWPPFNTETRSVMRLNMTSVVENDYFVGEEALLSARD